MNLLETYATCHRLVGGGVPTLVTPAPPPIEDLNRRDLLRGAGALGAGWVLAGCARTGAPGTSAATSAGTDDASPAAAGPGRVATLGLEDAVLALGVTPVGVTRTWDGEDPAYLAHLLREVPSVGNFGEPDLEALALSAPDVVLTFPFVADEIGAQLEQFTHVRLVEPPVEGGVEGVRQILTAAGRQLGLEVAAATRLAEHERVMTAARERLAGAFGRVAFLRITGPGELRIVTPSWGYIGPVLYGDLGLTPTEAVTRLDSQDTERTGYVAGSLEVLTELEDAETIFHLAWAEDDLAQVEGNAIWQQLPAVRSGAVHPVSPATWATTDCLANEAKARDVLEVAGR